MIETVYGVTVLATAKFEIKNDIVLSVTNFFSMVCLSFLNVRESF